MRRDDLAQYLQAEEYMIGEIEDAIKKLHSGGLIVVSQGRYSTIRIA